MTRKRRYPSLNGPNTPNRSDSPSTLPPEPLTPRSSGTIALWDKTVVEAMDLLRTFGLRDDVDTRLYEEGKDLQRILRSWDNEPQGEERARVISRVMTLYRDVSAYVAPRRGRP
jgi:hypothetical protein